MLSHHVQRLGRDWVFNRNIVQRLFWDGPTFQYVKRTVSCSYLHLTPQNCTVSWRLLPLWTWQLPSFIQTSSIHLCSAMMKAEGDEPSVKRRRKRWDQDISPSPDEKLSPSSSTEASSSPHHHKEGSSQEPRGVVKRHWEYFCQQSNTVKVLEEDKPVSLDQGPPGRFEFTVMSYNILSQDLLEDNSHLYKHCRRQILAWDYRFPNILKEIRQMDSDVLCLQEVQEDHYGVEIKPSLEALGYHCEYKMRTGRKPDGCAICFKTSKFRLLSSNPVEFFRRNIPLLDRDNVGLVLLLQPQFSCRAPTTAICVANTHLLYNPRRGDIKLTQLAMLLAEITNVAMQEDGRFYPLVVCGDFNSVPHSPLYNLLREGKLNYEGLAIGKVSGQEQSPRGNRILTVPIWPQSLGISQDCMYEEQQKQLEKERERKEIKEASLENSEEIITVAKRLPTDLQHSFALSSVYSHFLPASGTPEVTTCHSRSAVTVDYIFYSAAKDNQTAEPGANCVFDGSLNLLGRLSLVTEQELWAVSGLPNEINSSDHLPLLAKFSLEE